MSLCEQRGEAGSAKLIIVVTRLMVFFFFFFFLVGGLTQTIELFSIGENSCNPNHYNDILAGFGCQYVTYI